MKAQTLRILLAEADSNEIAGVLRTLYPDETAGGELTLVSTAGTLFPSLSLIQPDIILLDLSLGRNNPLDMVRRVRQATPRVPLLVLAEPDQEELAKQAVAEGAGDFLLKDRIDGYALGRAIRSLLTGVVPEPAGTPAPDSLNGPLSREEFLVRAAQRFYAAARRGGTLVFLCAELEGMPELAGAFGAPERENALQETGAILASCFRRSDLVCRFGKSSFAVMAIDAKEPSVPIIRQRVERRIAMRNESQDKRHPLAVNLGIRYWTPKGEESLYELMAAAVRDMHDGTQRIETADVFTSATRNRP